MSTTVEPTRPPTTPTSDPGTTGSPGSARPSRRHVLRAFGLGGVTVVVAGTGALSYRVFDSAALSPGGGHAYDPWQQWRDVPGPLGAVACAVLAANPHNTQPWTFHVTDTTIDVYADPTRTIGTVDPLLREQHIGLGCALENLTLGCLARGLQPTTALLPDGADARRVAQVRLSPVASVSSALYDAIGRRHTDRGAYAEQALSATELAALVDTTGLAGVSVQWISEPGPKATMGQLLVDAATALTQDEQQSQDSFAWFTGTNDDVQRRRDGMTLDAQGLSPLLLSLGKILPPYSRTAGDTFWVGQTRTTQTRTAAAYGIITATDSGDRLAQLAGGQLLQRIHLTATDRGLALQPMNQITERIDREKTTGAAPTFGPRFAALLPPGTQPVIAFRVGHPTQDARPSPRRTLTDVIR
ncbi:MAG: hypothetical protein ABI890_02140 [Lapillicoccus sp.]